jgi:hypothetical protein
MITPDYNNTYIGYIITKAPDNISTQIITLAPDDNIASQKITFHPR